MHRYRSIASRLSFLSAVVLVQGVLAVAVLAEHTEEITIHRDDFGIPHIFADSEEGVVYGMGYAQAEDRLVELLKQYRNASGTMSEAFGPDHFEHDYRQRLWQHASMSQAKYGELSPKTRAIIEAYQAGVRAYMDEHPDEVPDWATEIEPWMCVALGRNIIWGWPEGDAGGDMLRAGVRPPPIEYRGSNQWLVAPERTAYDAPIALIDPHLSWYGRFRFYEARLYGGDLTMSGMAILGMPFPTLGHNRFVSVAMTTGGPDAADCYEEEIHPQNPRQYRYDDAWRDMKVREEVIRVKDGDTVHDKKVEIEYTHHGPVVARKDGKAYVLKLPYFDQVGLPEQAYKMVTARNLQEAKEALSMFQLMEQNVMVGTVQGDIFYLRNGRVPIREPGYDYKRPIPGDTSKTEWRGIHALDDLVQLHNPPQGYMQNCNVSPQFMTRDCPLTPDKWSERPYLFNGFLGMQQRYDNPLHQRAAMCVELLHAADKLTVDQAISIAMNPQVYGADVWQGMLQKAWDSASAEVKEQKTTAEMQQLIMAWTRRCEPDTVGAIAYRYWKDEMGDEVRLYDRAGFPPPKSVTDKQILDALATGADKLKADFGRLDVAFGEVYRVGRDGGRGTWPVGGGSVPGIATPRAIGFRPMDSDPKRFVGRGGQTSTQIVLLTNPPKSWTVLPMGQSDDPASPHYDDQAEKLFSLGKMKPTYFLDKEGLKNHTLKTTTLKRPLKT